MCASAVLLVTLTWAPSPDGASKPIAAPSQRPAQSDGAAAAPVAGVLPTAAPEGVGPKAVATLDVPYRVEVRSPYPGLAGAAAEIIAVLEDPRGWQQAAIDFRHDDTADFVILVVEGEEAQALCQPYDVGGRFSCQNGPLVVLNAIRWREGVPHWPGDLSSYRTMLVNHEVGHLIGMHHLRCTGEGAVAPVMEQQSGTLRGCSANPWPTLVELRLAATHQFRIAPPPLDAPFAQ